MTSKLSQFTNTFVKRQKTQQTFQRNYDIDKKYFVYYVKFLVMFLVDNSRPIKPHTER